MRNAAALWTGLAPVTSAGPLTSADVFPSLRSGDDIACALKKPVVPEGN